MDVRLSAEQVNLNAEINLISYLGQLSLPSL